MCSGENSSRENVSSCVAGWSHWSELNIGRTEEGIVARKLTTGALVLSVGLTESCENHLILSMAIVKGYYTDLIKKMIENRKRARMSMK